MTAHEFWQLAYLIAIARGKTNANATEIADQAVENYEYFERNSE